MRLYHVLIFYFILYFSQFVFPQKSPLFYIDSIPPVRVEIGTYLGSPQRNYYGDSSPSKLEILWKTKLGSGSTVISKKEGKRIWSGCGWTGQPLVVREGRELFLLQGAFDHHLKKINAETGLGAVGCGYILFATLRLCDSALICPWDSALTC